MSLLRWDPRDELATMRDEMMRFMEENMTPRRMMQRFRPDTTFRLPLDAYVTDNEVVIVAAIPGVKPEDVEITFEDDTLTIKGEICGPLEMWTTSSRNVPAANLAAPSSSTYRSRRKAPRPSLKRRADPDSAQSGRGEAQSDQDQREVSSVLPPFTPAPT
jgi:hypothetical protein